MSFGVTAVCMKNQYKVLLIDSDKRANGELETLDWKSLNAMTSVCDSGAQALREAERDKPDLLVCNIRLPDMPFVKFAQDLCARSECRLIVYTSECGFESVRTALMSDVYAYLLKPSERKLVLQYAKYALKGVPKTSIAIANEEKGSLSTSEKDLRENHNGEIAEAAYAFIQSRFSDKLSVGDVARQLYISESHLMHEMKRVFGMSFHDCLTQCRIENAKELLAQGTMKVKEVAYAVGIADARYFARIFKQNTGMTPKEYAMNTI